MNETRRRNIDLLIEDFWRRGYRVVSRKYGTYLPEPSKVGSFDIDILARYKKDYAMGIIITNSDLTDDLLMEKIRFLATRKTKYSNKRVILFIGVHEENYKNVKALISILGEDIKKNIKIVAISEKEIQPTSLRHTSRAAIFA